VFESFSSHMCVLTQFNTLSVSDTQFIWLLLWYFQILFLDKVVDNLIIPDCPKLPVSKSVWFSYCAPAEVWRKVICRENSSSQSYNIWFVPSVPWSFVRDFFNFRLLFYYDDVNERRGITYTYIGLLYTNCLKIITLGTWVLTANNFSSDRRWCTVWEPYSLWICWIFFKKMYI
jgi:hypothetical protein